MRHTFTLGPVGSCAVLPFGCFQAHSCATPSGTCAPAQPLRGACAPYMCLNAFRTSAHISRTSGARGFVVSPSVWGTSVALLCALLAPAGRLAAVSRGCGDRNALEDWAGRSRWWGWRIPVGRTRAKCLSSGWGWSHSRWTGPLTAWVEWSSGSRPHVSHHDHPPRDHHHGPSCCLTRWPSCATVSAALMPRGNVCPARARRATFLLTIPTSAPDLPSHGEAPQVDHIALHTFPTKHVAK